MKLTYLVPLAAFAVTALGSRPTPPNLTFLFSANLTKGSAKIYDQSETEIKALQTLTGGIIAGPNFNGPIPPIPKTLLRTVYGGTALSSSSADGTIRADAHYLIETTDGANILVTESAAIPYVSVLFDTSSEKYDWLNNVTAWGTPPDLSYINYLEYWRVS
ncbi:uncharacterized protein N7483_012530 [Penicillium malachiteum]|uniref:uncharacterized protein n=1 Tax=Penicillium malachiteum TaxID=1324776 RepID=UPI0025497CE9|nr:uncharacterized protein N7483_012530 [Penicillium malachiteum]KAJ5715349.1 hypothetical protein N7483_012530 [Penicillium malachiteum]